MAVRLVLALGISVALSLCLTPVVRRLALRLGALDRPVERSVHRQPTPHLGGLAIFLAFTASILAVVGWGAPESQGIICGGALIVAVGVVDDLYRLEAWHKLLGQVLAACVLMAFGVRIQWLTNPLGGMFYLPVLGIPLTLIWVVAVINVVNLTDGLDGLAAGLSSLASLTLLIVAVGKGLGAVPLFCAALAGSALGFLPYNFNPAQIFMGDAGSMFLGYALAAVSVAGTLKSTTAVALAVPILALGLPIFDTSFAILRRVLVGRPVHQADQEHLHHRLLRLGWSQRQVVLTMYLITAGLGLSAILMAEFNPLQGGLLLLAVVAAAAVFAHRAKILVVQRGRHLDR
ncbi:MAG: undecaprenyl/decaprenyl-phosphate alpha-N-acetylglucosaminyl 1-phosphate transferase [Acetobacteraceae bacterium]|nr:undecaprenyl/decaprenyl-phosphate alpha-N-acetylglucosaminyl 1-phosphate transferase [Acetobacteraceae bacterium]